MSVQAMARVWQLDLSPTKKYILLTMADHADHEGCGIHPGIPRIAWKSGYSESHVRSTIKALVEEDHLLIIRTSHRGRRTVWDINFENAKFQEPLQRKKVGRPSKKYPATDKRTISQEKNSALLPRGTIKNSALLREGENSDITINKNNNHQAMAPTSVGEVDKALFSMPAVTPPVPPVTPKPTTKPKKASTKTPTLIHFSEVEHLWDPALGDWKSEAENRYVYVGKPNTARNQRQGNWTYPFLEKFDDKDWPIDDPQRYRNWLKARPGLVGQIPELKGKILVCDCDDLNSCHGNVLLHALRYPLIKKHNPIFDLVAMKSFDLKNTEGLDDSTAKRIGSLVKWLGQQSATIDQVSYFYRWFEEKFEDLHFPNNPGSFGPHWHACKQEALARKTKPNGNAAPESRTRENPEITFPKPAPVTHFPVFDHEGKHLGYYDELQTQAAEKGIPYDTYVEQLRTSRSAADAHQPIE